MQTHAAVGLLQPGQAEPVDDGDAAGVDEAAQRRAEAGAGGQLVGVRAEHARRQGTAEQPGHGGAGLLLGQGGEGEERVGGRMPGADDDGVTPGEAGAIPAEHVGQRRRDVPTDRVGAERVQPVRAERVGRAPDAGCVDDGRGPNLGHGAGAVSEPEQERLLRAAE